MALQCAWQAGPHAELQGVPLRPRVLRSVTWTRTLSTLYSTVPSTSVMPAVEQLFDLFFLRYYSIGTEAFVSQCLKEL